MGCGEVKWYLNPWFIALMFGFSWLIVPLVAGIVLLILHSKEAKRISDAHVAALAERDALLEKYGLDQLFKLEQDKKALTQELADLEVQKQKLAADIIGERQKADAELQAYKRKQLEVLESQRNQLMAHNDDLGRQINERKRELVVLDEELSLQEAGLYKPLYDFENSLRYMQEIERIRQEQKDMVRADRYANWNPNWTVNGSAAEGKRMNEQNKKMILRAFNNECDAVIGSVNHRNFGTIENRIYKAFEQLNRLNTKNQVSLRTEYLRLKQKELRLVYEHAIKKQEEKEEQQRIRELMREAEKVRMEIERQKAKLDKEKSHFQTELAKMQTRLAQTEDEAARAELQGKIDQLQTQLDTLAAQEQEIERYEKNTRAGYVYVISNIGSFGEQVFKIGMTRRLVPEERVTELGDASVPFKFDIHAMIFSEDAPTLEATLHKTFERHQVNKVNSRKEFFRVTLDEVERVVKQNHDKTVEFIRTALAEEYRQTLAIDKRETAAASQIN